MACSSLVALPRACGSEGIVGGLEKMWVIAFQDLATVTGSTNAYSTSVDGIVNHIALDATKKYVEIGLLKSSAGIEETLTKDSAKGTAFFTQTMTVVLAGLSIENKKFVEAVLNQPVSVLVKTKTQKYFAAGLNGLFELSAATGGTGIQDADMQGHTLTFAGVDTKQILLVDDSIVSGLI